MTANALLVNKSLMVSRSTSIVLVSRLKETLLKNDSFYDKDSGARLMGTICRFEWKDLLC